MPYKHMLYYFCVKIFCGKEYLKFKLSQYLSFPDKYMYISSILMKIITL